MPEPCPNCDDRKCMDCVLRRVHDDCQDSCPECCQVPTPEQDRNPKRPEVGTRWIWEADQPHAQETCEVTEVRWNGEEWWVKTRTIQRGPSHMLRAAPGGSTHWNNLSRFWEASTPLDAPGTGGEVPMPEPDKTSEVEVERLRENEQRLVEWLTAIDFPSGFSTTIPAPGFLLPLLAQHLAVEGVTVEEATAWLEDDQDFDNGAAT